VHEGGLLRRRGRRLARFLGAHCAERRDTGRAIQLLRKFEELLAKRNAERDRLRKELGL